MSRFRRTPLAWKNLTHNVRRLLVAVSGVVFAVVLMFMERGFQNALFDSTVALVQELLGRHRAGQRFALLALHQQPVSAQHRLAGARLPGR